ncbi:hypothetical protein ACUXI4_000887 [Pantoea piersonii]|jgi:hypothetical protein
MHIIWLPTPFWSGRKSDDKATLTALKQNISKGESDSHFRREWPCCAAAQGAGADKMQGISVTTGFLPGQPVQGRRMPGAIRWG